MNPSLQLLTLVVAAYLLGSVPFGLLIAKMKGVDIRRQGSGNVGATNVGRVCGRGWGILVFLLDTAKGMVSTIAAADLIRRHPQVHWTATPAYRDLVWLGIGTACIVGSIFPVYLRFRGGKGVAASLGVILGVYPYLTWPGLTALLLWAIVVKASGFVSLGSIVAVGTLPVGFVLYSWMLGWTLSDHYPLLVLCVFLAALVLFRHRDNMSRLLAGTENRIGH
ncbi:MAG TPA: glycerol-3-phosphate 1-O-acyltransferase PlsY [Phycisphaerae bacterium]|nr:glycerol-3-phosphate 1-O-acyltransferase PlsY [Phycisphaerae bacterium]